MSVSKSDHPLPVFTASTEWDDFVPKFITHIGLFGLDVYWDESNIPASDEPDWLPRNVTHSGRSNTQYLHAVGTCTGN